MDMVLFETSLDGFVDSKEARVESDEISESQVVSMGWRRRVTGTQVTHEDVRAAAVEELQRNQERRYDEGNILEDNINLDTFDEYLEHMQRPGTWGDHATLTAVANILETTIKVYWSTGTVSETHPSVQQRSKALVLRLAFVPEKHYDSTKPIGGHVGNGPEPPTPGQERHWVWQGCRPTRAQTGRETTVITSKRI